MKTAAAIAFLALAATPTLAEEKCPPLHVAASVEMIPMPNGEFVVPVTIADEPYYFWVGTAAPYSSLSASVAKAHDFPRVHSNVRFVGLGGEVSDKLTIVPSFGLGRLKADRTQFLMVERDYNSANGITPVGTLGADFLRAYDVELDFGARKLNLISREHCNGEPVYWPSETMAKLPMLVTDANKITFKMTLDGHELQTILNTSLPRSTLKLSIAQSLYDIDPASPDNKPAGKLGDGTALVAHRFHSLGVDGLTISNPLLILMPSRADEEIKHLRAMHLGAGQGPLQRPLQPELALGMAELRHLHLYIDYHHQMIYMTPSTAQSTPADPSPAP